MKSRIFLKLLLAAVAIIALATITLDTAIRRAWEESLRSEIQLGLTQKVRLVAERIGEVSNPRVTELATEAGKAADARVTVIRRDGTVVADTNADPSQMENHATRPEFAEALQHAQTGSNVRRSHTLGIDFLYIAMPIEGGAVRLAYPLSAIQRTTAQVRSSLLTGSLLALLISILLAAFVARAAAGRLQRITAFAERIAAGDLSARVQESSTDELGQLAAVLDRTARQLETNFAAMENSRRQLEALLNSMQEAVAAIGQDSKLVWANGALRKLLPVRDGGPLLETMRDPNVIAAVGETLVRQVSASTTARSLVPGRVFEVTAAPMPGIGAVIVLHDISGIERVEKTRRDFIANVSHELRTPLTSIQGYVETLLEAQNGHGQEFLEIISRNAARMTRLTEDLLALARVESGEHKLELRPYPAADLLREARANLAALAQEHRVELEVEGIPNVNVVADHDAIQQVLANLLENAIKYASSGGRVVLGARELPGGMELFVRDFGPGIGSEHLPRVFERFYRVDKARSRETGGTGLGLAIVKHIVLNHGGTVRVDSKLGRGSTFFFTLPTVNAE